jgi:hypothetical protein
MLTLNVTNRIIMKITVWLIPTRQRFDNCLLKKFNYNYILIFTTSQTAQQNLKEKLLSFPVLLNSDLQINQCYTHLDNSCTFLFYF